jgi:hypothetical protein
MRYRTLTQSGKKEVLLGEIEFLERKHYELTFDDGGPYASVEISEIEAKLERLNRELDAMEAK